MATDKGQFQPGYVIDKRYRILSFIGAGGFASVYRAVHEGMQREVAIKVMEKCDDESFIERFKREAMLAGSIQNPCIVAIHDCGVIEETGQLYTAMELLHGHDLEEELKEKGPLSPHRMYTLIRPVLDALGEGHAQGIVHKDLKPSNLFLNDPGGDHEYVKVLDFGVARKITDKKITTTGQMTGTVLYLAPEYINSTENVSPAIDVYQMALIISELLTGKPCVEGEVYSILMKHCMGEIEIADFLKEGPAAEIFARATCVRPEKRYQNCTEFGEALDSIADYFASDVPLCGGEAQAVSRTSQKMSAGFAAKKTSAKQAAAPDTAQVESSETPTSGANKPSKIIPIVAGIVVIAIVVVVLAIVVGGRDKTVAQNDNAPGVDASAPSKTKAVMPNAPAPKQEATAEENANAPAPAGSDDRVELNAEERKIWESDLRFPIGGIDTLREQAENGNDENWANLGLKYGEFAHEEEMFDAFMHIQNIEKLDESKQRDIYFYIGRFLYERNNTPKTPAMQMNSKYEAVECFRKAVRLRNFESILYLIDHKELLAIRNLGEDVEVTFKAISDAFNSKWTSELAYQFGTLLMKNGMQQRREDACESAKDAFELAAQAGYPRASAKMLESMICLSPSVLPRIESMALSDDDETNSAEAKHILSEWAISSYNGTLENRCWYHPDALSAIEEYFSEKGYGNYLKMLAEKIDSSAHENWESHWGEELATMVRKACNAGDDIHSFLLSFSSFTKIAHGNVRQACDAFEASVREVLSSPCKEQIGVSDLLLVANCYDRAIYAGQLYAPFKDSPSASSVDLFLQFMQDFQGDAALYLNFDLPIILYAASTLNDGVAQSFLGSLYRDIKTDVFIPNPARACYWDKLATESDICKSCANIKQNHACMLCDASRQNARSCP